MWLPRGLPLTDWSSVQQFGCGDRWRSPSPASELTSPYFKNINIKALGLILLTDRKRFVILL